MGRVIVPATDLEKYGVKWNELAVSAGRGHPLLLTHFLVPLIQSFGTDRTKLAIMTGNQGEIWGAAAVVDQLSFGRLNTFCPPQLPMCPILLADAYCHGGAAAWLSFAIVLSLLRIDRKYQRVAGIGDNQSVSKYGTTMAIDCDRSSFEQYWSERHKSLRKNLRRYHKRVESQFGELKYELYSDRTEIRSATERYAEIESKGWKGRTGTALKLNGEQTEFYIACLEKFAEIGGASVHELHFNNQLVASRLCVEANGILVILKTTYDEQFADFAPGRLLLFELLQRAFMNGHTRVVEFYTKADSNQLVWATESRNIVDMSVYRNRLVCRLASIKRQLTLKRMNGKSVEGVSMPP